MDVLAESSLSRSLKEMWDAGCRGDEEGGGAKTGVEEEQAGGGPESRGVSSEADGPAGWP